MARFAIIRVNKLKTPGNIGGSGQHGFRERPTDNADPARLEKNQVLCGPRSSQGILEAVNRRVAVATHKSPKDPVLCLEYLIAYSPEAEVGKAPAAYFSDALAWLQQRHGKENVVSAMVHHDETTSHLVVYAVPIEARGGKERKRNVADGKNPDGSQRRKMITQVVGAEVWLSAAAYVGSRAKLRKLQDDFARDVGKKHGLVRGIENSGARHTTIKQFYGFLQGDVPDGFGPEYAKLAQAAKVEAMRQKQAAEAARKRVELLEEQLGQVEERLEQQRREVAERLSLQEKDFQRQAKDYQTTIDRLSQQLRGATKWVAVKLNQIWSALFEGGAPAVRETLLEIARDIKDLKFEDPPEYRIEVRELADGDWRATVIDATDVEVWTDTHASADEAKYAAEEWIQQQSVPVPGF